MKIPGIEARSEIAMACGTPIPFGRHKGETIARVGSSDSGLEYLVWMAGLKATRVGYPGFAAMLDVYLVEPLIVKRLGTLSPNFEKGRTNP